MGIRAIFEQDGNDNPVLILRASKQIENVAVGATSAQSAAIAALGSDAESIIRLVSTTLCYVTVGSNPTATNAHIMLPSNFEVLLAVPNGHKIAVIRDAADGRLGIYRAG